MSTFGANLDRCVHAVNITALRVTTPGPDERSRKRVVAVNSEFPLRLIAKPLAIKDWTGTKKGDLTAVGLYRLKPNVRNVWSCRCLCGNYTVRTGASLSNGDPDDCCCRCKHNRYLARRQRYITGVPGND